MKKIILIVVTLFVVLAVGGILIYYYFQDNATAENNSSQGQMMGGGFTNSEDMVSAYGVTSIGVTDKVFEVENMTGTLYVEEVYISSGTEVEEGTKILKISEDSVEDTRKELTDLLREAELAYRAGAIEFEQSKITAAYERDNTLLSGEQAQEVYNETISGLEDSVEQALEELTDAKEEIAEYEAAISGNTYYEDYEVEKYKKIYDDNLALLKSRMEEWGVSWQQVTSGSGGSMGGGAGGGQSQVGTDYASILASLYSVLEQNLEDYEQAQSDYEEAVGNAELDLQTLQLNLSSLEQAYSEAKSKYDTSILEAKLTYETSLSESEQAESNYETDIEKAQMDYDTLLDAKEDAAANLALFEETVGDGYLYAEEAGTILRMMMRAEGEITTDSRLFSYSNPDEMTVTVSVDQADISKLSVGDSAVLQSDTSGNFEGIVTQISPVSSSSSRTSVTYSVTVKVSGDTSALTSNETVTVLFGMGGTVQNNE